MDTDTKREQTETESASVAAPSSQASVQHDPTPKAKGIPTGAVLYNSGDSFKRFMDIHAKALIKKMREAKIISKGLSKAIRGQYNSIDLLLAEMKKMPLDKFIDYLDLLMRVAKEDEEDTSKNKEGDKKAKESDGAVQRTFKDDAKKLMEIMKGSLEAMKPEPNSRLDIAISKIVLFVHQDDIQSQTEVQTEKILVDSTPPAPLSSSARPPPDGQLEPASKSKCFTNEGGILYSPLHGVTVTIPPNAIPGAISQFFLSMHFYLLHPFTLEDNVEPCSVIVWFCQSPQFHFLKDVTIKIPHAAIVGDTVDDSLCVLTWGEDKQLKLNTKVPADFSDGYHAVFCVKHFCPKVVVKTRKPTRRSPRIAMKPEPDSRLDIAISKIELFVTQTEVQTDKTPVDSTPPAPLSSSARPPPDGQLPGSKSKCFTNEGGTLFSPMHGVTVTIPPNAIPGAISQFFLSMHFYLLHPFTLEDNVEPCSVIVWFCQSSQFHFLKDVTIKIPHAAIVGDTVDDSLCVLTWGEDKQLKLNTKVPADFSDGYHAVFCVKHFCPKVVVKTRKPTRRSPRKKPSKVLERMGSSSIEKSFEEGLATPIRSNSTEAGPSAEAGPNAEAGPSSGSLHHQEAMDCESPAPAVSLDSMEEDEKRSDMKYSIVCGMPCDRSQRNWNVVFAACYSSPTWSSILQELFKKEFGVDAHLIPTSCVRIRGGYFELCKENAWSDDNWVIESHVRPSEISVEDIHQLPAEPVLEKALPPRISFEVSSMREYDHSRLSCWIEAQGAVTKRGKPISFRIDSTPPPVAKKGERVLWTPHYLYSDNSDIINALVSSDQEITLDIGLSDHRKFLADISFQISDDCKQRLCQDRPRDEHLDTYMILSNWVAATQPNMGQFKKLLERVSIINIQVCGEDNEHQLLSPHLEKEYIIKYWSESSKLRGDLPQKLQCSWKDVGRLAGISENDLESKKSSDNIESSCEMLFEWQKKGATFGALFKAVHRMSEHRPAFLNDAHHFCIDYVEEHLPN